MGRFVRLGEAFIDKYFTKYEVEKLFMDGRLVSITIRPKERGIKVYIWDKQFVDKVPKDSKEMIELEIHILEEKLGDNGGCEDMKEMITYFLESGAEQEYFYYDFGEGMCVEEIPEVMDAYDWEEKQIIPILNNFDIFETGSRKEEPRCNYFDKGSRELSFIRTVLREYGSIKFGDVLEIGLVEMTPKEFEELEEVW